MGASLPGVLHPQAAPPLAKGPPPTAGLKGSSVPCQVGVPVALAGPTGNGGVEDHPRAAA